MIESSGREGATEVVWENCRGRSKALEEVTSLGIPKMIDTCPRISPDLTSIISRMIPTLSSFLPPMTLSSFLTFRTCIPKPPGFALPTSYLYPPRPNPLPAINTPLLSPSTKYPSFPQSFLPSFPKSKARLLPRSGSDSLATPTLRSTRR